MAIVLSAVTPATVRIVLRSWFLCDGSTDAMASAADAPQIATAPADNTDWSALRPKARDADTQDIAARKVNAGCKALVFVQKIECHAKQKRVQHGRSAKLVADEPDGERDRGAQKQSGHCGPNRVTQVSHLEPLRSRE
jgi:hypothetical protein